MRKPTRLIFPARRHFLKTAVAGAMATLGSAYAAHPM